MSPDRTNPAVLMIVTSHDRMGDTGEPTGLWLEELAAPYMEFANAGLDVDIASPKGGRAPIDPHVQRLLADAFDDGRLVAAVCHGPAALVNATLPNGEPLVRGRRVTGFTDEEERQVKADAVVPFMLETALRERGARFESGAPWEPFTVRDGRLVTGQNPQSSAAAARDVLSALGAPARQPT